MEARILERLVKLLAAARSAGTPIIHLQNDGAPGSLDYSWSVAPPNPAL
jgi:nicotinamidase-related amidase